MKRIGIRIENGAGLLFSRKERMVSSKKHSGKIHFTGEFRSNLEVASWYDVEISADVFTISEYSDDNGRREGEIVHYQNGKKEVVISCDEYSSCEEWDNFYSIEREISDGKEIYL